MIFVLPAEGISFPMPLVKPPAAPEDVVASPWLVPAISR